VITGFGRNRALTTDVSAQLIWSNKLDLLHLGKGTVMFSPNVRMEVPIYAANYCTRK